MKLFKKLNPFSQCSGYGASLWQCPSFLFFVMGIFIALAIVVTYVVGQRFIDPIIVVLIVLGLAAFLLVVAFLIVNAFEKLYEAKVSEATHTQKLLNLKDQFVFIAAHELRTPASSIKWALDMLRESRPNFFKEENKLFDVLKKSDERLLNLVDDILGVARIEGKTISVSLKKTSAAAAANDAVEDFKNMAKAYDVRVSQDISSTFPEVMADPTRLKEIFANLISNAIKYNKMKGEVNIFAEIRKGAAVLGVRDSGQGIDWKDQENVFSKFWRAEKTKESQEGTGLGLFIVKQLVELMRGEIWFESRPGQGSTFYFSLSVAEKN